jgi:hypothetical protein
MNDIENTLDKMLTEAIRISKTKNLDEMTVFPLDTITTLLPRTKGAYTADDRKEYKDLLIDLAKHLNKFWKQHDINLSVKTK